MVSAAEGARAAGEEQVLKEQQAKLAATEPKLSLLHHIAATQAMQTGFTVMLRDGGSYETDKGDFIFTDGLSINNDGRKIYIPLTAIKAIIIRNPGESC
jgi:hypothetical protein